MLGYESVYAIVIPIQLTELIFPIRRDVPWLLDRRGLQIAAVVFVLASIGVWWLWSQVGLQRYGPSSYQVSPFTVGLAVVTIIALVAGTLTLRPTGRPVRRATRRPWSPWLLGSIAFVFGLFWFALIALPYVDSRELAGASPVIPIGMGLVWAGLALLFVRYASSGLGWHDSHRLALISGALVASMLGGVLVVLTAPPIDQIGKLGFDLLAVVLLATFAWRLRRRPCRI